MQFSIRKGEVMRPALLTGLLTLMFVAGGLALAQHAEHRGSGVKTLSNKTIAEKLDGKKTAATVVEVTLGPGQSSAPHRHPGPVFGYVLEGEYEWAIDDNAVKKLKAGETFYEPTMCLHRVSKNPSDKNTTRVIATVLHPEEIKDIVIPEKTTK
jgi:quercetin dioxygenase-like cupin family protein